jgi:hypothetical protein
VRGTKKKLKLLFPDLTKESLKKTLRRKKSTVIKE